MNAIDGIWTELTRLGFPISGNTVPHNEGYEVYESEPGVVMIDSEQSEQMLIYHADALLAILKTVSAPIELDELFESIEGAEVPPPPTDEESERACAPCPKCGESRIDELVWDHACESVTCHSCGNACRPESANVSNG